MHWWAEVFLNEASQLLFRGRWTTVAPNAQNRLATPVRQENVFFDPPVIVAAKGKTTVLSQSRTVR
jgi:hypothetical protein